MLCRGDSQCIYRMGDQVFYFDHEHLTSCLLYTSNDSAAVGEVSIVAGHLYGSAPHYYANAKSKGKDVWMTEHYLSPATGTTPEIADAIALAEELHNSLTVGEYNAYVWWGSSATNPFSAPLIDSSNNPNYYGYAMAQFSRFVRPGYLRVNATPNPSPGVDVYKRQALRWPISTVSPRTISPAATKRSAGPAGLASISSTLLV